MSNYVSMVGCSFPTAMAGHGHRNRASWGSMRRDRGLENETRVWRDRVFALQSNALAMGGGTGGMSHTMQVDLLVKILKTMTPYQKIVAVWAMTGAAAPGFRVPLIDTANKGAGSGLNDGALDQANGVTGSGSGIDTLYKPSDLNTGGVFTGGVGYWENNRGSVADGGPFYTESGASSERYGFDFRSTTAFFWWGSPGAGGISSGSNPTNGHYYGQCSANTAREFWKNGSSLGTNTNNHDATPSGAENKLAIFNQGGGSYTWAGRSPVAYLTNGTLTSTEVTAMHNALDFWLIKMTRPRT